MPLIVQCPACRATSVYHRLPIAHCPACQASYPDAVRLPAERTLRGSVAPKPVLLVLGTFFTTLAAVIFLLLIVMAALGVGTYTAYDHPVTPHEFLRVASLPFGLLAMWMAAIAVALWLERPWARPLMLSYWLVSGALVVALDWHQPNAVAGAVSTSLFTLVSLAIAGWYLYGKDNVVAYYEARAAAGRASPSELSPP